MSRRLFMVRPEQILEHPADFPVDPSEIPDGAIEGWDCYAPSWNREKSFGPFTAVVSRTENKTEGKIPVIIVDYKRSYNAYFYYRQKDCNWYQSGCTLRFVRQKEGEDMRKVAQFKLEKKLRLYIKRKEEISKLKKELQDAWEKLPPEDRQVVVQKVVDASYDCSGPLIDSVLDGFCF